VTLLNNSRPTRIRIISRPSFLLQNRKARAVTRAFPIRSLSTPFQEPALPFLLQERTPAIKCICMLNVLSTGVLFGREKALGLSWILEYSSRGTRGCEPQVPLGHYFRRLRQEIVTVTLLNSSRPTRIRIISRPSFLLQTGRPGR